MILALGHSHELQAVPKVKIPSQIQKVEWQMTLAHDVSMSIEEVPKSHARDVARTVFRCCRGLREHQKHVRVLGELTDNKLLVRDRDVIHLLESGSIKDQDTWESVDFSLSCESQE